MLICVECPNSHYKRDPVNAAEAVILNSLLVRIGKWILSFSHYCWDGGLGRVLDLRSRSGQEYSGTDSEIEQQIENKVAERTKGIDDNANAARAAIEQQRSAAVVDAAKDAVNDAGNQKNLVREKLAADQLPNIRQVREPLEDLAQAGGKLNLHCFSLLSGYAVWMLFGTAALSLLLSLYAVFRVHRR
jgi:hypothetical protein